MKLLFCPKCTDIRKLVKDLEKCRCGCSFGGYWPDGINAMVGGDGVLLGIGNRSFEQAYRSWQNGGGEYTFRAFFIDEAASAAHVKRVK